MSSKPTYEDLGKKVKALEQEVAKRKRAEESLRESEERFRLAFENANDGVCLVGTDGNLVRVNNRMCNIFGYSKKELESMTVNDIAYPEDKDISSKFIEKSISGEVENTVFEKRYFHKQGHIICGQVSSSTIKDVKGNPLYFISHVQDITRRKQAEKKMLESEEKYRNLLENLPDVIYSLDKNAKVTAVNLPATSFFGYKTDEILGKNFSIFIHPEDKERTGMSFLEAIETRREWTRGLQFRGIAKDGSVHWMELNSHMQFDEDGNYKKEEGVLRDIDNRKKAEEAFQRIHQELEERIEARTAELVRVNQQLSQEIKEREQADKELKNSQERLNIMFEYAPDAYYLNDLNAVFIDGNRAAEKLTGYDKHELIGKNYFDLDLLDEEGKMKSLQLIAKIKAGQSPEAEEYRIKKKCGQIVHVEINSFLTNIGGKDLILGIARDITDRKETEKKLRMAHERLELRVKERTLELEEINKELEVQKTNLEDANTALKVLLKKRDEDRIEVEERILANFKELVMPLTDRLKESRLDERQKTWVDILDNNLRDIVSSFSHKLSSKFWGLTSQEFQVANFVKNEKTTKEIANLLGVATSTVDTYRNNIRRKLGIKSKKINLKTYLSGIE